MKTLTRLLIVFTGIFTAQAYAQVSTTFSGTIDAGLLETFTLDAFGRPDTTTLSVNLAGAPYVVELTYSGSTEPDSTDNDTVANWSGGTSASYFIYSPESTSEVLFSGDLSEDIGVIGAMNATVDAVQQEQEVEGSTATITINVLQVNGTDSLTWLLSAHEGSFSASFFDENYAMVNDVTAFPGAPSAFTSSSLSLVVDTYSVGNEDVKISFTASEQFPVNRPDQDGDGIPDSVDTFPNDPNESKDTDGDGVGDIADVWENDPARWSDEDGDGFSDQIIPPSEFTEDGFPQDPTRWLDADGDGKSEHDFTDDGIDNPEDGFPEDPTRWLDEDGDDVSEHDFTDDGIDNPEDAYPGDGFRWSDIDGDGYSDQIVPPSEYPEDMFPEDPTEWLDSDFDGYGDLYDKCDASNTDPNAPVNIDLEGLDIEMSNRYLTKGCWMADAVEVLINRADKGNSGVALATNYLVQSGEITGREKGEIVSQAAKKVEARENGKDKPEDKENGKPEDKGDDESEDKVTGKPEDKETGKPENKGTGKPEEKETGKPEEKKTDKPAEKEASSPDENNDEPSEPNTEADPADPTVESETTEESGTTEESNTCEAPKEEGGESGTGTGEEETGSESSEEESASCLADDGDKKNKGKTDNPGGKKDKDSE